MNIIEQVYSAYNKSDFGTPKNPYFPGPGGMAAINALKEGHFECEIPTQLQTFIQTFYSDFPCEHTDIHDLLLNKCGLERDISFPNLKLNLLVDGGPFSSCCSLTYKIKVK